MLVYDKVTFYITSWDPNGPKVKSIKNELVQQGVLEHNIGVISERISRPITLNRAIRECKTEYVGFCEDDVFPASNAVKTLNTMLEKRHNVGLAIAFLKETEAITRPAPELPENSTDEMSLANLSNRLFTLNFVLFRKSTGILFDESYFGNQFFDWDFGLELLRKGYLSVADRRTAVAHHRTEYNHKNLFYHACVARNCQILMAKWENRGNWNGLADYNSRNANAIPTLEELSHSEEEWLWDYIFEYEPYGFKQYFVHRFGDLLKTNEFTRAFRDKWFGKNVTIYDKLTDLIARLCKQSIYHFSEPQKIRRY